MQCPNFDFSASSVIQAMDITNDPCEDFFRFACGGWIDSNEIPDEKNIWARFDEVDLVLNKDLKGKWMMMVILSNY